MQFEKTYTCIDMIIGYEFTDPWNWDFLQTPQIMVASNIKHMKPYSIVIDERILQATVP